jgi:hypothetical protein
VPSTLGGYADMTGYHLALFTLGLGSSHTITFGVRDIGDGGIDSALLIDAVQVPEPGSLALISLALVGLVSTRRRAMAA